MLASFVDDLIRLFEEGVIIPTPRYPEGKLNTELISHFLYGTLLR